MERKIVFIDVDGTLVNYHNELPDSAVEAVKKAQENGHLIYLVTGRSKAEMYDYILDIGFDGYIGGNGSYIEKGDEVIKHQTLSKEETTKMVDWLHRRGLEFYLESNSGLYGSEKFQERGDSTMKEYSRLKGDSHADAMSVNMAFPNMVFPEDLYRDDINKISFILDSYQDYLDAKETFSDYKVLTWGGHGEKALFGDMALDGIDKQVAIKELLDVLGMDQKDTIAIGDAKVDIPMLEYCQVGIAVDSGGPEIKAMADYITDAVDDDGLYNAFKHFNLID